MADREPIISVRNLTARFDETDVLRDISLDIYPGEITVILGTSGCGKTTLLKNLLRLYEPASGSVRFFGEEVTDMNEEEMNRIIRRVGVLFQNGALINSMSVFDNVAIPLRQHTNLPPHIVTRIVESKLAMVNLSDALDRFPAELSGGMKKRAALARAMAMDPEILFFDEPSAGLDPVTSHQLDRLILEVREKLHITLVVVSHELASIYRIADRVIFLSAGRVLFNGPLPDALRSGIPEVERFFRMGRHEEPASP